MEKKPDTIVLVRTELLFPLYWKYEGLSLPPAPPKIHNFKLFHSGLLILLVLLIKLFIVLQLRMSSKCWMLFLWLR